LACDWALEIIVAAVLVQADDGRRSNFDDDHH
jgi:hypothetical protein